MQITINLTDEDAARLTQKSGDANLASEDVAHKAPSVFFHSVPEKISNEEEQRIFAAAFGTWKDRQVDGVEYQRRMRSEW